MKDPERLALACGSAAVEGLSWRPIRFIGVKLSSEVPRIWIWKGGWSDLTECAEYQGDGPGSNARSEEETSRFGKPVDPS